MNETHEIPLGAWIAETALRRRASKKSIWAHYYAGKFKNLRLRRVNSRKAFVILDGPPPPRTCGCGRPGTLRAGGNVECDDCRRTARRGRVPRDRTTGRRVKKEVVKHTSGAHYDRDDYRPIVGGSLSILEAKLAAIS